jgi:hypothetical protein
MEPLCRAGEGPGVRHGDECAQLAQRDIHSVNLRK